MRSPQPGPSTEPDDDSPASRRGRPPKRAQPAHPSDDDDSDSDDDAGSAWKNSTDLDAERYRMQATPTHEPGFQLPKSQNWSPFHFFFSQNLVDVIVIFPLVSANIQRVPGIAWNCNSHGPCRSSIVG